MIMMQVAEYATGGVCIRGPLHLPTLHMECDGKTEGFDRLSLVWSVGSECCIGAVSQG